MLRPCHSITPKSYGISPIRLVASPVQGRLKTSRHGFGFMSRISVDSRPDMCAILQDLDVSGATKAEVPRCSRRSGRRGRRALGELYPMHEPWDAGSRIAGWVRDTVLVEFSREYVGRALTRESGADWDTILRYACGGVFVATRCIGGLYVDVSEIDRVLRSYRGDVYSIWSGSLLHKGAARPHSQASANGAVGDSTSDMQAGRSADVLTIGYANKPGGKSGCRRPAPA